MMRALSPNFRLSARYAAFYGGVFLAIGFLMPFWPVWLKSRGLGPGEIGVMLAIGAWIRVLTDPLVAGFVDRSGRGKSALVLFSALSALGFAAFIPAQGFWQIAAVTLVVSIFFRALVPLGESQTMAAVQREGLDYGRIRLWGSVTFIAGALGGGHLLTSRHPDMLVYLVVGAVAITFLTTLTLPAQVGQSPRASPGGLVDLMRQRRFLLFLAAVALNAASHAVLFGFSALHWKAAGMSEILIGLLWSLAVVAEIVLFAFSGRAVKRVGPTGLLLIGALCGVVRWIILAQTTALPGLVVAQLLHAATFGAAHLGSMHFISHNAPAGLKATVQAVYASCNGLAMGLTMLAAGAMYGAWQGNAFYVMAALSVAAVMAALALRRSAPDTE